MGFLLFFTCEILFCTWVPNKASLSRTQFFLMLTPYISFKGVLEFLGFH
jgi:hypothetical protein